MSDAATRSRQKPGYIDGKSIVISESELTIPFVDLPTQTRMLEAEFQKSIMDVVRRCDFILGSETEQFEAGFANYLGSNHSVGVASGLDALQLGLRALGIQPGDEVIVPTNSFIATALAVSNIGARPVFVDCDPHTYNIDISKIEPALTKKTRAVIPVHLTGQPAEMSEVMQIADAHGLSVIEDAAQAHGALYRGQACGTLGHVGCFSFYPGKNLGAFGDGGAVVTNNEEIANTLKRLRHYGQHEKNRHTLKGVNSRLDTIQAAVLNVKLRYLTQWNEARAKHAQAYRDRLDGVGDLKLQTRVAESTHVYHLFVVETERRDGLQQFLSRHGVQTGIHYPVPIHLHPAYEDLGYKLGDFPVAENLASRSLSLPMFPELQDEQLNKVTNTVIEWFQS